MHEELRTMMFLKDRKSQEEYLKTTKFWKYVKEEARKKMRIFYTCLVTMGGIILTAAMKEWFFCIVCGLTTLYLTYLFWSNKS